MKTKGFTLIEMLIVLVIISVGIIAAVQVIKHWLNFVDKTRKKVIAINLAREGVEAVYNIRNTNFKRWAWVKDKCWLKADPLYDDDGNCDNDDWIQSGYRIAMQNISGENKYWILTGREVSYDKKLDVIKDWRLDPSDKKYALCLNDSMREACPDAVDNLTPEGRFFRMVEVKGLWDKRDNVSLDCINGEISSCWNSTPKELVFCVSVEYLGLANWREEICSSITNFLE